MRPSVLAELPRAKSDLTEADAFQEPEPTAANRRPRSSGIAWLSATDAAATSAAAEPKRLFRLLAVRSLFR
jgi:hypothetical protein